MRRLLLAFLLLPGLVNAADFAWHASASGPTLSQRGSWLRSPPLTPPAKTHGSIRVVNWRYQLSGPAPSGLQVRLCALQRCAVLEGASGTTRSLANVAADEPLRLVFGVMGKGRLPPGLRVVSSEVMVNYLGHGQQ
ncbi:flagellar protein FlhE [Pantoea osteomyelitidis]|uniref:Flagellar protein FlhE n=1 Tax=Pantoea osteomyelitidis TaxID=3230026 RepID=A0ABW7PWU1_9GAMM